MPPAIVVAVVAAQGLGFTFAATPILGVALVILLYNLGLEWAQRRTQREKRAMFSAGWLELLQVVLDYAAMFVLIHLTGGAASPLLFFFTFHVIFAAILLPPRMAWLLAAVAVVGLVFMAGLNFAALITPPPITYRGRPVATAEAPAWVAARMGFFAAAVFITAGATTTVMTRLRRQTELVLEAEWALANERSRFVLQVAHNLRAPLDASISMLDVLRHGFAGQLADHQRQYLDRIRARLAGLSVLVQELVLLGRSREPAVTWERQSLDLVPIVRAVALTFAPQARESAVSLQTQLPDSVCALGDARALRQVLENLVSNALRYTPSGGSVTIRLEQEGATVVLEVADTGIGIPARDLPRLFEPFFRAANARAYSSEGTGLGLAYVKEVVDRHGGTIEVHSQEGEGSRFIVRLPAARAGVCEPSAAEEGGRSEPVSG